MFPHRNPVLGIVWLDEPDYSSEDSDEPDVPRLSVSLIRFCPYSERIRLILSIKDNPLHMQKCIDSIDNPGDFLKRSGTRKNPYIKYDDKVIYDSLLQADFLDEQYPELPLWNCSPSQKIVDKLLIESFAKVETAVHKLFMTTREVKKENFDELVAFLVPFEEELVKRGSIHFGGEEPNMVDVLILPWFVLMDAINPYSKGKFIFPFDVKFPKLAEWKVSFADLGVQLGYPKFLAEHIELIKNINDGVWKILRMLEIGLDLNNCLDC